MNSFLNINVIIDVLSIAAVMVVMLGSRKIKQSKTYSVLFSGMCISVLCVLISDLFAWLFDGETFFLAREMCFLFDTVYYISQISFCYFWFLFACFRNVRSEKRFKAIIIPSALPLAIEVVLILTNPFSGWIFSITQNNVYIRGTKFYFNFICRLCAWCAVCNAC